MAFFQENKFPHFSFEKFYSLFFNTGLLFLRIQALRVTFKAVIMAAGITKAEHTTSISRLLHAKTSVCPN